MAEERREEEGAGVLLYYKYAPVTDIPSLLRFYDANCRSLALRGRVRIAPDGVNVTIGGTMSSLEEHIAAVKSMSLFDGTDFKLASCDHPCNERIAKECGFTSLSIRVVKELVTFQSDPLFSSPEISNAGKHLSSTEFHSIIQNAGNSLDSQASAQQKQVVLLDARNLYETRIGKFETVNVETMDPKIRQYSDLSAWIDKHSQELQGKQVLMYCTGGIRCEMASAYLRSKGAGFENVYQLFGGIQRYLEQFPEGGYFKGKNFVFDHRISVGTQNEVVIGSCLICGSSFDDYSSRCRCHYCRMLVLVCYDCQAIAGTTYICELCQKNGKVAGQSNQHSSPGSEGAIEVEKAALVDNLGPSSQLSRRYGDDYRKLRILCLHGFRQNASNFKGRTQSLAKKLKNIVEFVFIDAPHELSLIYQPLPTEVFDHSKDSVRGQPSDLSSTPQQPLPQVVKRKFAWLISPNSNNLAELGWKMADEPFDPLQYQQQTHGFHESYVYIKNQISQSGPFDGVLGFSQGAAMAALFCEHQQKSSGVYSFRFAILCSGFPATSIELGSEVIRCPSLHCFGNNKGHDRQISCEASRRLADMFDKECSVIIEHDMGHIIPTGSPYIDQMEEFLKRFLCSNSSL